MKKIVVAIDGFSSCGKSTMAKQLAKQVGYIYVDTGAMYRAVGLFGLQNGIITKNNIDEQKLAEKIYNLKIYFKNINGVQHVFLNDVDVESKIRTLETGDAASRVSAVAFVRKALVAQQQKMGENKGVVLDGRDIGTVVFPDAELKIFVTASAEVRAQRRFDELVQKGENPDYEEVLKNITERDYRDTHRVESPLRQASDALLLDNSFLTKEQQYKKILEWFKYKTQ
ncbi:MAG: (d)CMP kinase [Prevotellaceae bacterium]|jgi:cytidylate kinase|nr:(d)CMP kinase [Prevotellaceae bacterium]